MIPLYDIYEQIDMKRPLLFISKEGENPLVYFEKIAQTLGQTHE